jgi:hypothetical protein
MGSSGVSGSRDGAKVAHDKARLDEAQWLLREAYGEIGAPER